jgi:carbamoyltransferase
MLILGISALDKDSTASLVKDGRIVAALSEERLTRVKQQSWFPFRSIEKLFKDHHLTPADINRVAFAFLPVKEEWKLRKQCFYNSAAFSMRHFSAGTIPHVLNFARILSKWTIHTKEHLSLVRGLEYYGLLGKLEYVNHHLAHAASAYFTSGFDKCIVLTMDALGSGSSGGVYLADPENGLSLEHNFAFPHSLAIFYQRLTAALGFKPDRHEGKILGLAAFGKPDTDYAAVRSRFVVEPGAFYFKDPMNPIFEWQMARRNRREDVAAVYQRVLEELICGIVDFYAKKHGIRKIALAGGLFANVKANQRIAELDSIDEVFVHPGMGDVGVGTGAALQAAFEHEHIASYCLEHAYLGPSYSDKEIKRELDAHHLQYQRLENGKIAEAVARLLVQGQIIGRFNGAMEYGPRALGNRTILVQATDPDINNSLNKKLHRTEFMPFAPAVLEENADQCFIGVDKARHAAGFMTITFDCTDFMRKSMPAAVHVDGTARPQLVSKKINPDFYDIITEYKKITGIPGVINTSFNMHEEPIVCSPADAIRGFLDGRLDYLAIGNYLCKYPGQAEK